MWNDAGEGTKAMKRPKKSKPQRSPKKQTSQRVASAAARLLSWHERGLRFYVADHVKPWRDVTAWVVKTAASALSQDETPRSARK